MNIVLLFLLILLIPSKVYAYIDPGTGGILYQIVVLAIGAVAGIWLSVKGIIKRLFKRRRDE